MGWSRRGLPADAAGAAVLAAGLLLAVGGTAQDEEPPIERPSDTVAARLTSADPVERYSTALEQIQALQVYNDQMQELISAQQGELQSLEQQVGQVEIVKRSIPELMQNMVKALEEFVELDIPFNLEERRERVAKLKEALVDAELKDSERYRRIMEAYTVENEFGRTIDAYRASLTKPDGEVVTVDYLRVGRIALLYQTLDESESGTWDQDSRSWVPLGDEYTSSIRQALRIARKQAAPDLVNLPLPAAGS